MRHNTTYIINQIKRLVLLLFILSSVSAKGQMLSLDSILKAIEVNHPLLKKYDAKIQAYNNYASGAKALDPPQVGAGFFMTPYNPEMWRSDEMTGSEGMGSFMISAQQMFMSRKKLNANEKYMQSMADADKEMKSAMRNEIFSMAKMNYYEWLMMKKKLQLLDQSEELLKYILKSAEIRYTYGMDKLNAYYKAKAMLGDNENMRLMVQFEIQRKIIALNTLMVRKSELVFDIDTIYIIRNYEQLPTDTNMLANKRSDFKFLNQNINVLKAKQNYERSKLRPDFGIKYDHMVPFGTQPKQFSLMAMITIPIVPWSSAMYKSSVAALNYEIQSVKYEQQSLVNNAVGELESIKEQIRQKKMQIGLYEKNIIPSMIKNYQTELIAYEQNKEELFMVLDAWQNLKTVQFALYDLINELLLLQVNYERELEIN